MSKGSNKPPVLVVVQLTGGCDFMNTLVPYNNSIYYLFQVKTKNI